MIRKSLVVLALAAYPAASLSQDCAAGAADSSANAGLVLPEVVSSLSPGPALRNATAVLEGLGYSARRIDSTQGLVETAVSYRYPDHPLMQPDAAPHPGIQVTVRIRTVGDSSYTSVSVQSQCRVALDSGATLREAQVIGDLAELTAASELLHHLYVWLVTEPLSVEDRNQILGTEDVPVLIECEPPDWLPSTVGEDGVLEALPVQMIVQADGTVDSASVVPLGEIGRSIRRALVATGRSCRYVPAHVLGYAVPVVVQQPIALAPPPR